MLEVDRYLARRFHHIRQNCWHMTRDAWLELTGEDIAIGDTEQQTYAALSARYCAGAAERKRLEGPADPCLVLMRSPGAVPHVGVYYLARVLQMTARGASYVGLEAATAGFRDVEFYR